MKPTKAIVAMLLVICTSMACGAQADSPLGAARERFEARFWGDADRLTGRACLARQESPEFVLALVQPDTGTGPVLSLSWLGGSASEPRTAAQGSPPALLAPSSVYTSPTAFEAAVSGLVSPTVIDFEDIDASPVNNTYLGRDEFDGDFYASRGVTLTNPMTYPLYIAPGGLVWNASNSLSVGRFPYDSAPRIFFQDDDLYVGFDPPCMAASLTLVDASEDGGSYVQFLAGDQSVVDSVEFPPDFTRYRAFAGIVSTDIPIAAINVVEAADDGDDVNYDDITCYPWVYRIFLPFTPNGAP